MKLNTFADVLIKPKYSEIESREQIDLSTKIGNINLNFPIISANMRTITGADMARKIHKFGGYGILHRFYNSIEDNIQDYKSSITTMDTYNIIGSTGVSIGVKDEEKKRFEALYEAGARCFCIDVAHGHHKLVRDMLRWINNEVFLWDRSERNKITIIAGNIATHEALQDLVYWGTDAVKVGIGPGRVCTTRKQTGVGVPQLYALQEIYDTNIVLERPVSIIADGGCSCVGDIAKALKYADAVMIGSMIAGTDETPGDIYKDSKGIRYKIYGGSASRENKGHNYFIEGITVEIPYRGPVKPILYEIKDGLRSAFSYTGSNNLQEFKDRCEFIEVSDGGRIESKYD